VNFFLGKGSIDSVWEVLEFERCAMGKRAGVVCLWSLYSGASERMASVCIVGDMPLMTTIIYRVHDESRLLACLPLVLAFMRILGYRLIPTHAKEENDIEVEVNCTCA
jgi:hypothetical protein